MSQIHNTVRDVSRSLKQLEKNAMVSRPVATKRVGYLLGFFSELGSMGCPFSSSFIFGLGPRFFGSGFGSGSFFSLKEIDPVTILQGQSQRYGYRTWSDRLHTLAFLLSATVPIVTGVIQNIKNNDRAIFLFIDENSRIRIRIRYSEVRIREYGSVPNVRFRIRNNACYTIKQFLHFHSKRCAMFENFPKRKCPQYRYVIIYRNLVTR